MPHDFPQITPVDALAAMASPNAPARLDIRLPEDVAEDTTRLPGAVSVCFDDIAQQASLAAPNGAIVICHKGLKLSAGVTARLRARGVRAWRLQGGHVGWTRAGLTTMPGDAPALVALPLEAAPEDVLATWATIRFAAPRAELLEVPLADLPGVLHRFGARVANPPPALPGLSQMGRVLPALDLALNAGPPSASFPLLDQVYNGAVRATLGDRDGVA
ncbi:rhodanese-like domain-containing protein [Jannaschia sp. CCS1]|uniref:rhodanese-like domain-containing protein n=1 Tax=Jannaschia sp. (strain CCS1) TaxID=290400 RepID=UPI000053CE82|nr:hypothetical protein [Jannaschia sp. CCS1]ABD54144.1 hypothetical protein Jann_1227 [Jannaschia sp. CCS1]